MRTLRMCGWIVMGSLLVVSPAWALPMGTAFTYQGFLEKPAGTPLTDTCDFRFYLLDAPMAANIVGDSPQVATGVSVASGNFSVEIDFGTSAFTGEGRWITIEVKCTGDGAYVLMSPAVELTPAPYALALPGLRTPETATVPNVIGGGTENIMSAGVEGGTIAGGGLISPSSQWNVVTGDGGTVGGGTGNGAADFSTVAGGYTNRADGVYSFIGGGGINLTSGNHAFVGGGSFNTVIGSYSAIAGGLSNEADGPYASVGGGNGNGALGESSTVGGGDDNSASGIFSTVAGGAENEADGQTSTVGGGLNNRAGNGGAAVCGGTSNDALGTYSAIPGGWDNLAGGDYSFAAGNRAKVRDDVMSGDMDGDEGTFVWADSVVADFVSTGPNQFLIRANGGVGINTNDPNAALDVQGTSRFSGTMNVDSGTLTVDATNDRVGVGDASPGMSLEVRSPSYYGKPTMGVADGSAWAYLLADTFHHSLIWNSGNDMRFGSETNRGVGYAETMRITGAGRVGIGTTSPISKVEIAAQDGLAITGFQPFLTLRDTNASNARARIANAGGNFNFFPESYIGGSAAVVITNTTGRLGIGDDTPDVALDVVGDIHYTGVITDVSDERLKEDIRPVECALDKVSRLRGVTFAMKGSSAAREAGLIAQDVKAVLPEAVRLVDEAEGHLGVSYAGVTSLLVEAVKEVRAELRDADAMRDIEELRCQVVEKDREIEEMRDQLRRLDEAVRKLSDQRSTLP